MARLTASTGSWKSDHRTKHDPNETNGFNSRQLMRGVQSVEHRRLSTRGLAVRSLETTPLLDARDERRACTDSTVSALGRRKGEAWFTVHSTSASGKRYQLPHHWHPPIAGIKCTAVGRTHWWRRERHCHCSRPSDIIVKLIQFSELVPFSVATVAFYYYYY